jgi:hypothetical protein
MLKFIKGSLIRNSAASLTEELLDQTQLAEEARERRKKVSRKVIQKGGTITVSEARKRVRWRQNLTLSPMRQRYKNIPVRLRKRYGRVMEQLKSRVQDP